MSIYKEISVKTFSVVEYTLMRFQLTENSFFVRRQMNLMEENWVNCQMVFLQLKIYS